MSAISPPERSLPEPTPRAARDPLLGGVAGLPVPLTSLVGRERELALAWSLLCRPDLRLLTVTGPGGIGKSRFALQIAAGGGDAFADGVCFIPLAAVSDPDLVGATVAHALGVGEAGGLPVFETLAVALRDAELLLVLDNFEHLLAVAPFPTGLLAACRRLKILVVSRALLRVAGEHALPLPPLALPDEQAAP